MSVNLPAAENGTFHTDPERKREKKVPAWLALFTWLLVSGMAGAGDNATRELDSHRMIGKAHYENGDFKTAAEEFRRCLELAPDSAEDRFNLALVLTRATQYEEALLLLAEAERLDPDLLNVHYLRGIVYKRQSKFDEAVGCLKRVAKADPACWGTAYNLGVCYKSLRQYDKAKSAFETAARIDPTHPSALYQLIILARHSGDVEGAKRYAEMFELVKATLDDSEKTPEAMERSRYTEIFRIPRRVTEVATGTASAGRFCDVTAAAGFDGLTHVPVEPVEWPQRLDGSDYREAETRRRYVPTVGGALALNDYDNDGDLDIYLVRCGTEPGEAGNRLFDNRGGGQFIDVTSDAGVGDAGLGMDAVFGDLDNDGHDDLYVVNCGPNVLYRNRGDRTFENISQPGRADEPQFGRQAILFDYDHDNDLDILVVNDVDLAEPPSAEPFLLPDDCYGQVNALLRNNGNRTFTDQTDEAGILVDCSQSVSAVFADFDGDDDTDVFVANADAPSLFFANARLGRFTVCDALEPPIETGASRACAGDVDRDGDSDLLVVLRGQLLLYANDGKGDFTGTPVSLPAGLREAGVGRVELFDCDNDGWLDLLLTDARGRSLWLLVGQADGVFREANTFSDSAGQFGWIADLATGDLDGDGDEDIVVCTRDAGLRLLRNDQDPTRHWITVELAGTKVNRGGYGSSVEIAAGNYYQRQTARTGRVHFGLADLEQVDVVRVTWPNGVAQNVIRPPVDAVLRVEEKVRVSASCTMLWANNGTEFEFINEILGVGALGVPIEPGVYHTPDCTELTKIEAGQLAARDGLYELRLTEELREITYADQFTLRVVDHPPGLEIIPNEMFTAPPFPEDRFYAVEHRQTPRTAIDDRGSDVLPLVSQRDGRWPAFPVTCYQGLAETHSLTLDFGDLSGADPIMLYLDGWIHWPESSTVVAISQDPRFEIQPLSLDVCDSGGRWHTVIDAIGLPTSKGAVVPVDLTDRFLCADHRIRLTTNLCLYFDRIFVSTGDHAQQCIVSELPVSGAKLHYRGFSRMTRDPFGYERFDYRDVSRYGSWNPPAGMFTQYGDVTPLLIAADDQFAIFGPGDELILRFDATGLPAPPDAWTRDFIFYANGWVKDGDLNTALSGSVEPLPHHGMTGYPYGPHNGPLDRSQSQKCMSKFNTRSAVSTTGRIHAR